MADREQRRGAGTRDLTAKIDLYLDAEETTPDLLRDCLWRVLDTTKDLMRTQRRASVLLFSIALAFERQQEGRGGRER
ncbi:MAG TPA: hypothetical protein VGR06_40015 [Actinophytocola sp.]|jgi:hypothetical protein|uniref:hypothetical protein n=1 Tax=Actinophytocola sp. TaxID=1872138 RepID=UPI002E0AF646|nr:hypothetical protein [Actinophytocola sp.]